MKSEKSLRPLKNFSGQSRGWKIPVQMTPLKHYQITCFQVLNGELECEFSKFANSFYFWQTFGVTWRPNGDWLQIVFPCLALYFLLTWALLRLLCCRSGYYVNCTICDYTLLHIKCPTVAIGKRNQKVGGFTALFPNYRTFENFYRCAKSL